MVKTTNSSPDSFYLTTSDYLIFSSTRFSFLWFKMTAKTSAITSVFLEARLKPSGQEIAF